MCAKRWQDSESLEDLCPWQLLFLLPNLSVQQFLKEAAQDHKLYRPAESSVYIQGLLGMAMEAMPCLQTYVYICTVELLHKVALHSFRAGRTNLVLPCYVQICLAAGISLAVGLSQTAQWLH